MSLWTKVRRAIHEVARFTPLLKMFVSRKTVVGKVAEAVEEADRLSTPK